MPKTSGAGYASTLDNSVTQKDMARLFEISPTTMTYISVAKTTTGSTRRVRKVRQFLDDPRRGAVDELGSTAKISGEIIQPVVETACLQLRRC